MTKPKLILHAGTHKTGTTAIQEFCANNRTALERRGISYPTLPISGKRASQQHHDFAHAFSDQPVRIKRDDACALAANWAEQGTESGFITLISAEPIWRHILSEGTASEQEKAGANWLASRDAYLSELAWALRDFDTNVILVFRNPIDFIQSLYIELISSSTHGVKKSFAEFSTAALDNVLRYGENTKLFAKHFSNVQCLNYEQLCESDLLNSFFASVHLDISGLEPGSLVRKSMSPPEAKITNYIKSQFPESFSRGRIRRSMRDGPLRDLIDDYHARNQNADFWEDNASKIDTYLAMAPQIKILQEEFDFQIAGWCFEVPDSSFRKTLPEIDTKMRQKVVGIVRKLSQANAKQVAQPSKPKALRGLLGKGRFISWK